MPLARFSHYRQHVYKQSPVENMLSNFLNPVRGTRGMAVAPHALASQSALAGLREGGNPVEAMIAAAPTIAVGHPPQNSIGGEGVLLVLPPPAPPGGVEGCG